MGTLYSERMTVRPNQALTTFMLASSSQNTLSAYRSTSPSSEQMLALSICSGEQSSSHKGYAQRGACRSADRQDRRSWRVSEPQDQ
jgi:hypothetical protein